MAKRAFVTAAMALALGASSLAALAQSSELVNGQVTKIDESAADHDQARPLKKFDIE